MEECNLYPKILFCFNQLSAGRPGGLAVLPSNTTNVWLSLSSTPTTMIFFLLYLQKCKKKGSTAESAWQRGEVQQFDASRRKKKMLDSPRSKNEGTCRSGEGGEGPAM